MFDEGKATPAAVFFQNNAGSPPGPAEPLDFILFIAQVRVNGVK